MTRQSLFMSNNCYRRILSANTKPHALTGIVLAVLTMLISCDADPFGRNQKKVVGSYILECFDEGGDAYYLVKKGTDTQGGVFEAVIEEIGWSQEYIVCKVKKQYRGDVDGIYSVAVSGGKVEGPFKPSRMESDARFKSIKLENVQKVFNRL